MSILLVKVVILFLYIIVHSAEQLFRVFFMLCHAIPNIQIYQKGSTIYQILSSVGHLFFLTMKRHLKESYTKLNTLLNSSFFSLYLFFTEPVDLSRTEHRHKKCR